jgi:hypothetical protein
MDLLYMDAVRLVHGPARRHHRICRQALDRLAIDWRMCRPNTLSLARREAVARLDGFVGPKW